MNRRFGCVKNPFAVALTLGVCLLWLLLGTSLRAALPFTAGNLAVLQAAASVNNTTCSILELSPSVAQVSPINTVAISGSGANALRISGSATSTGYLADSEDGTLLAFTGVNNVNPSVNANTLNPRGVGTLDNAGNFILQMTYTGTSGNQTRGASSINNSTWYVGDQGGVYTNGVSAALTAANFRSVKSFGGTLYLLQQSTTAVVVSTVSADGKTVAALPGLATDSTAQDFYLIPSGNNGSVYDVLYVLTTAGIKKYSLASGTWTANSTYATVTGFGLCAASNGSGANLYVTTGTGATTANSVIRVTDTAGFNSTITVTTANNVTLYTGAAGTILKGIAFTPALGTGKPTPAFSNLTASQSILTNTASLTLTGRVSAIGPVFPAITETVSVTINGASRTNNFRNNTGDFSFNFPTATLPAGNYAIIYSYTGSVTLNAAVDSATVLSVTNPFSLPANNLPPIQTVFVIAMENHNWTQPIPSSSPQQIFGNVAAPYINSLVTPGHTNAAQVSYCTRYFNAGVGVHGSEPNYVWAEAGTDFGVHTDNDPSAGSGNIFSAPHLTAQLNAAGITWKNYQEDVQYTSSPLVSKSGSGAPVNPYHGTTQYDYGVKHNPMAFFSDTQTQNVFAFTNFLNHLTNGLIGRYNWITPDEFNNMHSALSGGFTYKGTAYTGDQAAVAQGDNFLSKLIPQIMASPAYKTNGVIVIWWDESEGGDTTNQAIGEIIISPLAKGNAYNSLLEYSHSSDVKLIENIFGLTYLSNAIPAAETRAAGNGYNHVANVNDLSDLLVSGTPPASFVISNLSGNGFKLSFNLATNQTYRILASSQINLPLSNWTQIASGTVVTNPVIFTDTNIFGARFYRALSP